MATVEQQAHHTGNGTHPPVPQGADIPVENPATGQVVAHVPDQVHLKVEFEVEDDGTELEIELTW